MKHYCMCWINSRTGEIEHAAVSDRPLQKDHIHPNIKPELQVEIPGNPPIPPLTYAIEEFDLDIDEGEGFVRGKALMEKLEIRGNRVEVKVEHEQLFTIPAQAREPNGVWDGIAERVKPARTIPDAVPEEVIE